MKIIDNFFDTEDTTDLPMNTKVIIRSTFLDGNFPKMLEIFFINLIQVMINKYVAMLNQFIC